MCVCVLKTENTVRVHLCTGSKQDYKIDKLKHMVQKSSLRGGRKGGERWKRGKEGEKAEERRTRNLQYTSTIYNKQQVKATQQVLIKI